MSSSLLRLGQVIFVIGAGLVKEAESMDESMCDFREMKIAYVTPRSGWMRSQRDTPVRDHAPGAEGRLGVTTHRAVAISLSFLIPNCRKPGGTRVG